MSVLQPHRSVRFLTACAALAVLLGPAPSEARLGRAIVPTFQSVNLRLDPAQPDYSGSVRIELEATAPVDSFQLHARDLRISGLSFASRGGPIEVAWSQPDGADRITVRARQRLTKGTYTLDVAFAGTFDRQATGLYRLQSGDDWYVFTQFEADHAREAFPCWDEPSFKIPWQVTLEVPAGLRVYSNTLAEHGDARGGYGRVTFHRTRPMPSYIVALAVGPFESVPIAGMSVPGSVVTVKGQSHLAGEAARAAPRLLAALEDYFRRPYPYDKLDLIAVPEFLYGAMENAGLITFADRTLLVDPETGSVQDRRRMKSVLAHELAHMWFGDLVTMEWWDDLWLNESFASWMGDKVADRVFPEYGIAVRELEGRGRALATDALPSARAIRRPLDDTANLGQMADALAYDKGQAVLGMVEQWMGEDAFRRGIVDYLNAFAWRNARAADLWAALGRASKLDVGAVMSTYLDEAGIPFVSAELHPGGKMRLRQSRFAAWGGEPPPRGPWRIPIVMRFSDGSRIHTQRVLLSAREATVSLDPPVPPKWLHVNSDEAGYYRWRVAPELLRELAGPARGALTPRERVGLIENLAALLQAGEIPGDDYLRLVAGFGADPEPQAVEAVLRAVRLLRATFLTPEIENDFARYVRATLRPALDRIGVEPGEGETEETAALRPQLLEILGDDGRDPAVVERGRGLALRYLADPRSVSPALVASALRLAALSGDSTLYGEFLRRFEQAAVPADRQRFLSALGYFREPGLLQRTLEYASTGPLRPRETTTLLEGFNTPALRDRLWEWVRTDYDRFMSRIPPVFRAYAPYYAGGCTRERIEEARAFFSVASRAPKGTDLELAKAVERIEQCVTLREREGARVARALAEMATAN